MSLNLRLEIFAVVSLLAAGCASSSPAASATDLAGCDVGGAHFESGQAYCCASVSPFAPAAKGNTCRCVNGQVDSSALYCDSTADAGKGDSADATPAGCENAGVHYDEGQKYCCGGTSVFAPSAKGNTCSCTGGQILSSGLYCDSTADSGQPDGD